LLFFGAISGIGYLTAKRAKDAKKETEYLPQGRQGAKEKTAFRTSRLGALAGESSESLNLRCVLRLASAVMDFVFGHVILSPMEQPSV